MGTSSYPEQQKRRCLECGNLVLVEVMCTDAYGVEGHVMERVQEVCPVCGASPDRLVTVPPSTDS